MLPGRTDYKISRSERSPLPVNLSQMSSDTGCLGMFAVCKEITSIAEEEGHRIGGVTRSGMTLGSRCRQQSGMP